jgi:hypothetical protein
VDGTLVEWELKLELSVVHGTQLSSEWDLSLGAGAEPWVQAHNTLGEPQTNLSSSELLSVKGDTFGCNLSLAPIVS